jgi:glucose-6-phosphate 1-epimerase
VLALKTTSMAQDIQHLNSTYGVPGFISFEENAGVPKVVIKLESKTSAEIYFHGAQVTSFRTETGRELIFLSSKAIFQEGKAILGGIPVIFPQFGSGPLPQHGFARNLKWTLEDIKKISNSEISVTFILSDNETTRRVWPNAFKLELITTVSFSPENKSRLRQTLKVHNYNTDHKEFDFTTALHTYFNIDDLSKVRIRPLKGLEYNDKISKTQLRETRDWLTFSNITDSVYLNAPNTLEIAWEGKNEKIVIDKSNFPDVVVWNPHQEATAKMSDLQPDDWKKFVCVEVAAVGSPVKLQPHHTWEASHEIHLES